MRVSEAHLSAIRGGIQIYAAIWTLPALTSALSMDARPLSPPIGVLLRLVIFDIKVLPSPHT